MKRNVLLLLSVCLIASLSYSCKSPEKSEEQVAMIELQNPVLPGYFADPSIVQHDGKFYMYVTADPWGGDFLSCWESDDFVNWTFNKLNWPTKAACTSPLSNENNVWAPSVVKKGDKFYMYISVGSEVWAGVADHPLGPWKNMLADKPMIPYDTTRFYHVIDAEAFIDDDGKSYLYWGSGWDWKNGRCFVSELNDDMSSFKTEPLDITPTRYFEGPLIVKNNGKYYLTYSEGITMDDTYEVRYAVGDNPFGPFVEAANSPVLVTNDSLNVHGPGHHTMFSFEGKNYILYHRHRLPFVTNTAYRQTCINEFTFNDEKSEINTIIPYNTQLFPDLNKNKIEYVLPESIAVSSFSFDHTNGDKALDGNYATRWEASEQDENASIVAVFSKQTSIKDMLVRFEYPWKKYFFVVEASQDNKDWSVIGSYDKEGVSGSPVVVPVNREVKYVRVKFISNPEARPSIWELQFIVGE